MERTFLSKYSAKLNLSFTICCRFLPHRQGEPDDRSNKRTKTASAGMAKAAAGMGKAVAGVGKAAVAKPGDAHKNMAARLSAAAGQAAAKATEAAVQKQAAAARQAAAA